MYQPETIDVPLGRAGKYGQLAVSADKFTDDVHRHVYVYGLRQILNDAIADKTDDDGRALPIDQLVAKAQKRLDTLYSGELRARRESAEPIDPIEREMHRLAKTNIAAKMAKSPEWAQVPKGTKDRALWCVLQRNKDVETWDDAIAKLLATGENEATLRKAATRIVREREAAAAVEL